MTDAEKIDEAASQPATSAETAGFVTFYHATSKANAERLIAEGVDLGKSRRKLDFGPGMYTTTDSGQAVRYARLRFPHQGAVVRFQVSRAEMETLDIKDFGPEESPEWQEMVWKGRMGILDTTPVGYDVVVGPYLTDPDIMTESAASAWNARGAGNQQAWTTRTALRVLQRNGAAFF